ncbi:TPA: glycerophosphodiester phosphodiesterase [Streptococcus agalactiae]|nr:glycerophosphodiester phosphodiesterase [Streptococcus agalactiae]
MLRALKEDFFLTLTSLKNQFWVYIGTGILIQTLVAYLVKGILSFIFRRILILSNTPAVTKDNWTLLFNHPLALLLFILYIVILIGFIYTEFAIYTIAILKTEFSLSIKKWLTIFPKKIKSLLGPQLIWVSIYLLLTIPLANLGLRSSILEHLKIPDFISGELTKTVFGKIGYSTLLLLICYLNLRLIYFLPLTILTDYNAKEALLESWKLSRGKHQWRLLSKIILTSLFISVIGTVALAVVAGTSSCIDHSGNNFPLQATFYNLLKSILFAVTLLIKCLIISHLLADIKQNKSIVQQWRAWKGVQHKQKFKHIACVILALAIGTTALKNAIALALLQDNISIKKELIAHRGDTSHGVENSIEALKAAHKAKADYSEMDVIMTKDHKLVVIHDDNLKRLSGMNKDVSKLTLDQVTKIPIHQGRFASHIPSFAEFMKTAQSLDQKIMIELKPYNQNLDIYADEFIKEFKELRLSTKHKVMSLNLTLIEKVEKKLPQLDTGYLIPLHWGTLQNHNVDFYGIEEFSYNDWIAYLAQEYNKQLYVWTINRDNLMIRYLQSPVNGIITDELNLFKVINKDIKNSPNYYQRALQLIDSEG